MPAGSRRYVPMEARVTYGLLFSRFFLRVSAVRFFGCGWAAPCSSVISLILPVGSASDDVALRRYAPDPGGFIHHGKHVGFQPLSFRELQKAPARLMSARQAAVRLDAQDVGASKPRIFSCVFEFLPQPYVSEDPGIKDESDSKQLVRVGQRHPSFPKVVQ